MVDLEAPFLGCSPDGVLDDRIVEIKCPFSARQSKIQAGIVDWLVLKDGHLKLREYSQYWYQVQGQMAIMKKCLCDLVVYTAVDFAVITVHAVPGLYSEVMVPKLRDFYFQNLVPQVVLGQRSA